MKKYQCIGTVPTAAGTAAIFADASKSATCGGMRRSPASERACASAACHASRSPSAR
jgi:hypothetical protein